MVNHYRNCHAIILVYDLEDEYSLHMLNDWIEDARKYSYDVLPVLWGNKVDIMPVGSEPQTLTSTVRSFMDKYDIPQSLYFKVSAMTGYNVKEALEATLKALDERASASCPRSTLPPVAATVTLPTAVECAPGQTRRKKC